MNREMKNIKKLSSEPEPVDAIRCDYCQRHLASASEWIRGEKQTICETCYRNFLNPGHNCPPREIG
ncbi:MAG: hypothetical protein PVG40_03495 [Desulfobacterales bacterium]|jgi:hypothetical protein